MALSNQITLGMTINIGKKIYRVESALKVNTEKGTPFIKTKLRDLSNDEVIEKNFKQNQEINEVTLEEKKLEYLYSEDKNYLFLDINNLEQVYIPVSMLGDKVLFLKEGTVISARFYGTSVFSIELPIFLELMIIKTQPTSDKVNVSNAMKKAVLETGAEINVPLFIETGDVIKVDTHQKEYIQRV